jgi:predicted Zn-dependent peptidase
MIQQQHTFPNQLKIIYEKSISSIPLSSIQVFCQIGSVHEPPNLKGASHTIEHMCFKGTKKHPDADSVFGVSVGSEFNAYTEKLFTCYYMKCMDNNLHNCINLLSDILFHSFFHSTDYEKEKNVVKEENIKDEDDLENILEEEGDLLLFGNHPYGQPVDTFKYHFKNSLPLKKVFEFYKKYYVPSNIIISIVSSLSFDTILSFLEKSYFHRPSETSSPPPPIDSFVHKKGPSYKLVEKKTLTTYISIGFCICPYDSCDKYSLEVFNTILSGGMNSFLFHVLREQNGLTYSSDVDITYFKNAGSFTIYTEESHDKIIKNGKKKGVLPLLIDTLCYFVKNGITKKQLLDAKEIIQENRLRNLEDTDTIAEYNGIELILYTSDIIPYSELFSKKYKPITIENVNSVIRKYFSPENMNVCLVGDHLPSLRQVQEICSDFSISQKSLDIKTD